MLNKAMQPTLVPRAADGGVRLQGMKVRQILLAVEAVLLSGPITGFVAYSFPLAFTIGVASLLSSLMDPRLAVDAFMLVAVLGCGAGAVALVMGWRLIGSTVKNRPLPLGSSFRWALVLACLQQAA